MTVLLKLWQSLTFLTAVLHPISGKFRCLCLYKGCNGQHPTGDVSAWCGRGRCTGPCHQSVALERWQISPSSSCMVWAWDWYTHLLLLCNLPRLRLQNFC